jgi:hypothetical protein
VTYPGQELLEILNQLRIEIAVDEPSVPLRSLKYRLESSGLERTVGLMRMVESSGTKDCSYFRKSLDIFLRRDYNDIYKIIKAIEDNNSLVTRARQIMEGLGVEG